MTSIAERSRATKTKQTDDARQGETAGRMRWVLAASLAFVVAGFIAVMIFTSIFAAHQ